MRSVLLGVALVALVAALTGGCATTDWSGMSEAEISQWKGLEVGPGVAQEWVTRGFLPSDYSAWTAAGFDVEGAKRWKAESFTASEAAPWKKAGFGLEDAVEMRNKGLTPIDPRSPE